MQSVDMKINIVEMGEFEIGQRGHSVSSDLKLTFVTRNRHICHTLGNTLLDRRIICITPMEIGCV